jgi:hypothetical protein
VRSFGRFPFGRIVKFDLFHIKFHHKADFAPSPPLATSAKGTKFTKV